MLDIIEKAFMAAIGTAALTQKKAEEIAAEMREKYKMSEEEGKAFLDRLQSFAKDGGDKIREVSEGEVKKAMERFGFVPREEFDRLAARVHALEIKLNSPCSLS